QAMTWVLTYSEARLGDRLVLLSIANHANSYGDEAWPSIDTLAEESRMSARQVQRAIQRLQKTGELEVHRGAGPNGTHRYRLPLFAELAMGDKLSPRKGDRMSPRKGRQIVTEGGDKSSAEGVTNPAKNVSDLSPKP